MLNEQEQTSQIIQLAKDYLSANVRSYDDDESIICEGQEGSSAFLILAGCVSIYSDNTHLTCRKEGELIGEQVLFQSNGKRTASVKALGYVELLEFKQEDICLLDNEQQLIFWEWYSRALSQKLAQATHGRVDIDGLRAKNDDLLKKFVPSSGIAAARTALLDAEDKAPSSFHKKAKAIIWFSDLADFSKVTEEKQSSEIAGIISDLLGPQITLIEESGGEIDKLMGDGLMAFWQVDPSCDISLAVERAVKTTLDANKKIRELVQEKKWGIGIRIGLHIGDVDMGSFGTADRFSYTILGEPVNTAARYEQARDKALGNIRISPDIFAKLPKESDVKNFFSSEPHTFNAKGRNFKTHVLQENES